MPKIHAASVREHREAMTAKLVDAAEALLVTGDVDTLTASAVTSAVGIARNSLYRYVNSVDDLRDKVVARHLPGWTTAVGQAVGAEEDALPRLLAYVASNLNQADSSGHGWLMKLAKGLSAETLADIAGAHHSLSSLLMTQCRELDPRTPEMTAAIIQAILEAGFARLDAGDDLSVVRDHCLRATRAVIASLRAD